MSSSPFRLPTAHGIAMAASVAVLAVGCGDGADSVKQVPIPAGGGGSK